MYSVTTTAGRAARGKWRQVASVCRGVTAPFRALPDFLIVGEAKCGTTTLYDALERHPQVLPASIKEVHFFDLKYDRGLDWYRMHFPLSSRLNPADNGDRRCITGEASPYYMFHPLAARRIKQLLPDVKMIALLRNPIERAYSQYQHEVRAGRETLSFEDAIDREQERIAGERERLLRHDDHISISYRRHSYVTRGAYANQIEHMYRLFQRSQILVLRAEDFFKTPDDVYRQVMSFLGIAASRYPEVRRQNTGSYQPMQPATRERLAQHYAPHNERLYTLLGRDFGWK